MHSKGIALSVYNIQHIFVYIVYISLIALLTNRLNAPLER